MAGCSVDFKVRRRQSAFSAGPGLRHAFLPAIVLKIQREPKRIAKKNGAHMSSGVDIFSQLATILRSDW